jgi:2-oxoglutarate dehydrogenase complex dehydrogenase (E1) component-like enzyme
VSSLTLCAEPYCGTIGADTCTTDRTKSWWQNKARRYSGNRRSEGKEASYPGRLTAAEGLERIQKCIGQKRFSLEGGENCLAWTELVQRSSEIGVQGKSK